eukprot:TRINITY_DN77419_c0_g1_i1.p1 TRINITY_DN77419_c0_g1~~TRINITY_DN77419_c0_g1_i1.p1  ORF type:complete len:394 (+),score=57.06 TRINITY_DN77419_c0_g1_i1:33-1214(+)
MPKKPMGLNIDNVLDEKEKEETQAALDEAVDSTVSVGGSLYLKGLAVTKKGMGSKGSGNSQFLSLSKDDLVELGAFGKGSSGSVRKVKHTKTGQILAVKEIKLGTARHMDEIQKELLTLYGNKEEGMISEYIIDFFGAYSHDGSVYIALEAMEGSLVDLVEDKQGIPEPVLACITKAVLKGMEYLHKTRKLVHRDVKPQNLLFRKDGKIKITDFGVCSQLESTKQGAHSFVGTVTYMSPERLQGTTYGYSADIWGVGISLIQLATGEHPYEALTAGEGTETKFWQLVQTLVRQESSPADKLPDTLSDSFRDFVYKSLIKDKDERATASQLLEHPWITDNTSDDSFMDQSVIENWLRTKTEELGNSQAAAKKPEEAPKMSQAEVMSALQDIADL